MMIQQRILPAVLLIVCDCLSSAAETIVSNHATLEYCETEVFEATCDDDEVILVHSANYGRMRFGRCVDRDFGYVGCQTDVLHLVDKWCSGRRSCQVPVPNSAFRTTRPCPKDLKPYFEASFSCEKVAYAKGQSCLSSSFVLPEAQSGYISNFVTMETNKGSADCPWMIQGQHGQKINITLVDFGRSSPTKTNSAVNDYSICHVYAVIRERNNNPGVTVCRGAERERHVHTSEQHAVEIRVIGASTGENSDYYLLKYEVLGCIDPQPPNNMWLQRDKDVAVLVCEATGQKWRLVCVNSEWQGEYGNCTQVSRPTFGEVVWGTLYLPFEVSLVIVVAIAVGIGIVILAFGLICMRSCRRRANRYSKQPKEKPVHPVQPQRPEQDKPNTDAVDGSQGSLPPPPAFLMDQENASGSENEYSYIADMPPPPSTPPPTYTPDLPPHPPTPPTPPPSPNVSKSKETFPPPPPPMSATIAVQPQRSSNRRSPNFTDVSAGANIGKYRVVQEKTYDRRNKDWKFPSDYKYKIMSAPVEFHAGATEVYCESPKYFELDPRAVPSCNGLKSTNQTTPSRSPKYADTQSLRRPRDNSTSHKSLPKQNKSSRLGTM